MVWRFQIHTLSSFEIYAYCYEVLTVDIILSHLPQRLHSSSYNRLRSDSHESSCSPWSHTSPFFLIFTSLTFLFFLDLLCKWGHEVHAWRIQLGSVLWSSLLQMRDFLLLKGWVYSIVFIHSLFLICTSRDVYSGWFQILAVVSSAGRTWRFLCILLWAVLGEHTWRFLCILLCFILHECTTGSGLAGS